MLTLEEVCERYQVDRGTIWRWRKARIFPEPIQIGKSFRWDEATLDKFDKTGQVEMMQLDDKDWEEMKARTTGKWTTEPELPEEKTTPESIQREIRAQLSLPLDAKDIDVLNRILARKYRRRKAEDLVKRINRATSQ